MIGTTDPIKASKYYAEIINIDNYKFPSTELNRNKMEAMFELSDLLEQYPDLADDLNKNVFDPLDLLLKAAEMGHSAAQHRLAAAYSTGVHSSLVHFDSARALLLDFLAASSGNVEANMAMGYRYKSGIGVPESCELAKNFYEFAANIAAEQIEDRGFAPFVDRSKIIDLTKVGSKQQGRDMDEELADYYRHLAGEGDVNAALTLGILMTTGSRQLPQDYDKAIQFLSIASKGHSYAASGMLGYILVQSIGSHESKRKFSPSQIVDLLERSSRQRDSNGIVGLGLAYLRGFDSITKNVTHAVELFQSVAGRFSRQSYIENHLECSAGKHQDAGFYLGEILLGLGSPEVAVDPVAAAQYYLASSQKGNVLALHRISHLTALGLGVQRQCTAAVSGFKTVAERGDWMKALNEAHLALAGGDRSRSLLLFARMAAVGVESAQVNTAYLLSREECLPWSPASKRPAPLPVQLQLLPLIAHEASESEAVVSVGVATDPSSFTNHSEPSSEIHRNIDCEMRALQLFALGAGQGDSEALLRIGDMHYYGMAGLRADKGEAASFYQASKCRMNIIL